MQCTVSFDRVIGSMSASDVNVLKVVLCDDSDFVRQHLTSVLKSIEGVDVVGEADTIKSSIKTINETEPDVVVLDIQFPDGSGIDALSTIKNQRPETKVIMLTNHANEMYKRACLRAGAAYFFDKSREFAEVPNAIRTLRSN